MQSLISGYVASRRVSIKSNRIDALGVFLNKMGMLIKVLFVEEGGLPANYNIPLSVTKIHWGSRTQLVAGMLPHSRLRTLAAGVLPASLHTLTFGYYFNQPLSVQSTRADGVTILAGVLPFDLSLLCLSSNYSHALTAEILPVQLQHMADT